MPIWNCNTCGVETDPRMCGEWNCCKDHACMTGEDVYAVEKVEKVELPLFSQAFLQEVKSLALQIALRQRGENFLQSIPVLHAKFIAECQELAQASEAWDELPDVCYYTACMCIVRDELLARPFLREYDDSSYGDGYAESLEYQASQYEAKVLSSEARTFVMRELEDRGVTIAALEAGTLAKYRLRATQPKDIKAERAAILAAVHAVK